MRSLFIILVSTAVLLLLSISCTEARTLRSSTGAGQTPPPGRQGAQPEIQGPGAGRTGEGDMARQMDMGATSTMTDSNGDGIPDEGSGGPGASPARPGGSPGTGVRLPDGWPADVPIMEGFTLTVSMDKGNGGLVVGAVGDVPVRDTAEFYSKLPGWEVVSDSITRPGGSRIGRTIVSTSNTGTLTVYIESAEKGTQLNLTFTRAQ